MPEVTGKGAFKIPRSKRRDNLVAEITISEEISCADTGDKKC